MATIRITSDILQDHIESGCDLEITSFCWSKYSGGISDVEYNMSVDELEYDDDYYTTTQDFNTLKSKYETLQDQFNTLETESTNKIKELTDSVEKLKAQVNTHRFWYKPWTYYSVDPK